MIVEERFAVAAPVADVWAFFLDVARSSACMPGVEQVRRIDAATYEGKLRVKVGPLGTAFTIAVTIVEQSPPVSLRATASGKDRGTGGLVQAEIQTTLCAEGDGTRVDYRMDVQLRGPLGRFGQTVIQDTARRLSGDFARCVQARLQAPAAASTEQG